MIDRLEELLDQVENAEDNGESLSLRQIRAVSRADAAGKNEGSEQELLPVEREPFGEMTGGKAADSKVWLPLLPAMNDRGYGSGLGELYRQMSRSTGSEGAGRSGSVAVVRETVSAPAAGLTAGELDLAMRRDSRRYDGGMTIY